ncbi:MAG: J domain-containing protein [Xenococcaceae cyanobacterium MO_167.B52]|nr:J domain-containing protein [Xenococcaceae cyanobacterium MO_167.B52]
MIINLNPYLAEDEILLLSYYQQVKSTWSSSAIKNLKEAQGLKLTNKLNRCKFAIAAAKLQLQFVSSGDEEKVSYATGKGKDFSLGGVPEDNAFSESLVETDNLSNSPFQVELLESEALQIAQEQIQLLESQLKEKEEQLQQQEEQLKQSENFSFLLLSHRLLAPGLPLNGAENTPAMRVLGSPKTLTELDCNYRELIKREHPDVSRFPEAVAIERFGYLRSLYRITRENWSVLKPTAVITKEQLEVRMNAKLPFDVQSFWD